MGIVNRVSPCRLAAGPLWACGAILIGCGSNDVAPSAGTTPIGTALPENVAVQRFLDERYTAADVRHSFHTIFGEAIDCIDFFAQPGVKALAARGTPVTEMPPAPRAPDGAGDPLAEVEFRGQLDQDGLPRACPAGTVPILRITAADVEAAGGLERFTRPYRRKPPPFMKSSAQGPSSSLGDDPVLGDSTGFSHVFSRFNNSANRIITQGADNAAVFSPALSGAVHSLSQLWFYAGSQISQVGQTCTAPNCIQTIEVGWVADGQFEPDPRPRFFVYSTTDGYHTSCFVGIGAGCPGWVGFPSAFLVPGQILSGGPSGPQSEISFAVKQEQLANGQVFFDVLAGYNTVPGRATPGVTDTGYFPASNFNGGALQNGATVFVVGSEIQDDNMVWTAQMGSGSAPSAGYGQAAYHHGYSACTATGCPDTSGFGAPAAEYTLASIAGGPLQQDPYTPSTTAPAGPGSNWQNYFYVGDTPHVFWQQNYGFPTYAGFPFVDWAFGSYKGNCPTSYPISGLSTGGAPGSLVGVASHAFLCSTSRFGANLSCLAENFDSSLPGNSSWDWDPGFYKSECPANNVMQGIAQSTGGFLSRAQCCATAGTASISPAICDVEVFAGSNSAHYSGTDWDPGFYKGQCASGKVVMGVSAYPFRGGGSTPHAILCCPG